MGPQKIPEGENKQGSIEKILGGANLYNLRLQDRIHRPRIQNRSPWKRDVEDRLPPRTQPKPEKTPRDIEESSAPARFRRHPSQSPRVPRAIEHQTIRSDSE